MRVASLEAVYPDGQRASRQVLVDDGPPTETYIDRLKKRSDCFAVYDFTNPLSLPVGERDKLHSLYPNDPDPRQQPGAKIELLETQTSGGPSFILPIGQHHPQNLVIAFEWWVGAEWNHWYSRFDQHKLGPMILWFNDDWFGMRTKYNTWINPQTLPPGGPFVCIPYAHGQGHAPQYVKPPAYISNYNGKPVVKLPTTDPAHGRDYGQAVMPVATDTIPGGMEFGVVAERATRFWHLFERAPEQDWIGDYPNAFSNGKSIEAYLWSIWAADEQRRPVKILDRVPIGRRLLGDGITKPVNAIGSECRFMRFSGGATGNNDVSYPGRGSLVAYTPWLAVLHGTSRAEVEALLEQPPASPERVPTVCLSATVVAGKQADGTPLLGLPNNIAPGTPVTLRYATTQIQRLEASDGWSGSKSLNGGTETVTPQQTTTYTLTATNAQGSTATSVTVTVQ